MKKLITVVNLQDDAISIEVKDYTKEAILYAVSIILKVKIERLEVTSSSMSGAYVSVPKGTFENKLLPADNILNCARVIFSQLKTV